MKRTRKAASIDLKGIIGSIPESILALPSRAVGISTQDRPKTSQLEMEMAIDRILACRGQHRIWLQ